MLQLGDRIDHLQLDWVIGKVEERLCHDQAGDEDEHADCVKKDCVGDCAKKNRKSPAAKTTMRWRGAANDLPYT